MPALRVLILAAGLSTRLGSPKALARVRGASLLRRTVRVLSPLSASAVTIVAPPRCARFRIELRGHRIRLVENSQRTAGLSSSLRLGLKRMPWSAAILIVPVDLAGLRGNDLRRLIRRWCGARRKLAARRVGSQGVAPLILPKWAFAAAQKVAGDGGLRGFAAALSRDRRVLVDMPSAERDVDSREDLRIARRRYLSDVER